MNLHICVLPVSFLLDLLLGDPAWLYHPICLLGNGISFLEKFLRTAGGCQKPGEHPVRETICGGILALVMVVCAFVVPWAILFVRGEILADGGAACGDFLVLATSGHAFPKKESMRVYEELAKPDLPKARYAVSMIVGRDTEQLSEEGVAKATVETIAENASDGVAAPMFYFALFGIPGMFAYKAINTMDSMLGYKNERYFFLENARPGWTMWQTLFLPALTAFLMILASFLCKLDGKNAWRIFRRDRKRHASPNSAQTESVAAGALHLQLAGDAWYFGELHQKPAIGDKDRAITPEDIPQMNRLMYGTAFLGMICFALFRMGVTSFL